MGQPYIGEIRMFGGNFAPAGWASTDGQYIPLPPDPNNDALYTLIGTTYGGDGVSTYRLPDLAARAPKHPGQGSQFSHPLGEASGATTTVPSNLQSTNLFTASGNAVNVSPVATTPPFLAVSFIISLFGIYPSQT